MKSRSMKHAGRPASMRRHRGQFSRSQILRELVYELKPFVVAGAGFISAVYFTQSGDSLARFFSMTLTVAGLVILYWRAKERGVIQ